MGRARQLPVEAELVPASERPSGAIAKAVDVVELHGVEALCLAHVQPVAKYRFQYPEPAYVQPALSRPSVGSAEQPSRKIRRVGAPTFPRARADEQIA